ncbi:DUF3891 family protein [Nostoc sp. CHAB 5834]|nr:DUF3891 family protein [Nostoc sp. CHAB 5834]
MTPTTTLIPMIAHPTSEGWDIIHQQAHGLLAYQIATHWKTNQRSIFWAQTLTALLEHDDGQQPFSGHNHLSQAGAPMSFQPYSMPQCHRMIDIALRKSRWNALMVSHHSMFLYQPTGGKDKAMDEFLKQQKSNQKKWRTAYGASQQEVVYAYELLQWCDALSLILCRNQLPPEARQLEISKGPDGATNFIHQRADNSLRVDPWPFESAEFTVGVEVYPVAQLQFIDDDQLYKAINEAPVELREWVFRYT